MVCGYTPDRKEEHPQAFLKKNKRYFQSDAYSGFNQLLKNKSKS
ncbi:MAG: IS66 family transposase [Alphaproteobacteria bacterium]|nr:IS66 family transposase [Alphaproteobacteria bacterium]